MSWRPTLKTLRSLLAQSRASKEWSLLTRVDNANDTKYQLVDTYAMAGGRLCVGLKWAS
jgi:outer membrane cobalamin receptor